MTTYTVPLLRTRTQLIEDVAHEVNDRGHVKWDRGQVVRALNNAVYLWSRRVYIPYLYTLAGGWQTGVFDYTLPAYITQPLVPLRKILTPYVNTEGDDEEEVWADVLGYDVLPDGAGGQMLRLQFQEGVNGTTNDARILWWGDNPRLPDTADGEDPALSSGITSSDTSLTLDESVDVGESGYVKIGSEFMAYGGTTDDGSNTTLTNLVRGVRSTAAAHNSGDSVSFCLAATETSLWRVLGWGAAVNLYNQRLGDSPAQETEHYQWLMRWNEQRIDQFWRGWVPRSPEMRLSRRATGVTGR